MAANGSETRMKATAKLICLMTHFSFLYRNMDMRGKGRVSYLRASYAGDRISSVTKRRPGAPTRKKNAPGSRNQGGCSADAWLRVHLFCPQQVQSPVFAN